MKGMNNAYFKNRITSLFLVVALVYTTIAFAFTDSFAQEPEEANDVEAPITASTNRKGVSSGDRWPRKQAINLRSALGEPRNGYSVVQGGATDGTYAYNLLVSPYSQKGRILKTRLSDNAVVARSAAIDINHGNGMTYDSARNRLVIVGRKSRRNQVVIVNVGTQEKDVPTFAGYRYINYEHSAKWTSNKAKFDSYGIGAIAYVEKYDCYLAVQRTTKDLLVLNPEFKVIGKIYTKILAKYPGLYQSIDADERYVYFLLSPYNKKQPNNIILVLDWHGENLLDYVNGESDSDYIEAVWKCGSDGSPSAVIKTHTPYEAENIYHVYNEDTGRSRFYLSEYHNSPKYKWKTKKKAYKVKWKKVKKKVKWKKVKRKGKWKWKYKTKKVWKYKKKYKKYKVKVFNYYNRDNYLYDLGEI